MHGKFCGKCNRLRLTSTGDLKPCLCYADSVPLREILRGDAAGREERIREKIREAAALKPQAHCFETRDDVTEHRRMSQIAEKHEMCETVWPCGQTYPLPGLIIKSHKSSACQGRSRGAVHSHSE